MWSNDRFSSMSTTMWSIRERFSTAGSSASSARGRAIRRGSPSVGVLDGGAGRRQRPDHGDVERDDQNRPDRIGRDEEEAHERTEHGKDDADRSSPDRAGEDAESDEDEHDSEDEVDPAV